MNEQLKRAIAFLEAKYGWEFEKALGVYHVTMTTIKCTPLIRQRSIEAKLKEISEDVTDHQILALAKSAGWTDEPWEPEEGEQTTLLEQENKMLKEEVAELKRKLKEQDDGIEEMARCF